MNSRPAPGTHLIDRLPAVRGRLSADAPLAGITWFRVGGAAEVLFKPADAEDLAAFLAAKPEDVPATVIGVGSNLLVRDGGVPGVVIKLGGAFARIEPLGKTRLRAGGGALDVTVAAKACEKGIGGLEFLSGVPGTIGGALRMNAGAYGVEMKDVVAEGRALSPDGRILRLKPKDYGFSYRHCDLPEGWIFLDAVLRGRPETPQAVAGRMAEIKARREGSQPLHTRTGGSTFANPPGHHAWELIDQAGCRGLCIGGAQVSEKHCNFLINTGTATATDIEDLGEEVRRRVLTASGIELHWEIRRIGVRAIAAGAAEENGK